MSETVKKILLVEDEPIAQTLYQNRLQREGFEISLAENGEVAINEMTKAQPDLVVLDLMLPKVNGQEVLKRMRSEERFKKTPVLVISNAYMTELSKKAMESGATRGMLKTECTPARLVENVRDLLGFKSAFDLSDSPASDNGQLEAFADAAEMALADEMALKETRDDFTKKAPMEVAKIREHSLAYIKAGNTPAAKKPLTDLFEEVRFFATRAGLSGCIRTALLADALEALLFEALFKPEKISTSTQPTVAQAVDCLEKLCQRSDGGTEPSIHGKILVIDDDAVCNLAMVGALKRANFQPTSIEDPAKALQLAQSDQFDLVLLDINMPGMNGFELCEKLRAMPEYKETPIIFVTSSSDFQSRARSILSGGNDLIPKPVSPVELVLKTTMRLLQPVGIWAETSAVASCLKTTMRLLQEEEEGHGPKNGANGVNGASANHSPALAPRFPAPKPGTPVMPPSVNGVKRTNGVHAESAPGKIELPQPDKTVEAPKAEEKLPQLEAPVLKMAGAKDEAPKISTPEKIQMAEKPAEQPKAEEPPKPVELPKPVEAIKIPEPVEAPKSLEPEKAPQIEAPALKLGEAKEEAPKIEMAAPAEIKAPAAPEKIEVPEKLVEQPKAEEISKSVELPKPIETIEAVKAPKPVEAIKAPEPVEPPKPVEAVEIPKPAEPVIEVSKAAEPGKENLPHVNGANGTDKNIPAEIKLEAPRPEVPVVPETLRAIEPANLPTQTTAQPDSQTNRNTTNNMETTATETKKPTIDEAARGIARIIFGDENINDMNVRLTRIALESYNVHGTKDLGEVARHVTKIIFGDQNVTDMNVRLTRIALERYNVSEVLGISGSSNGNGARMNLTSV